MDRSLIVLRFAKFVGKERKRIMAFECMEDCIHLKACRRVQAIGKSHRLLVPRYCTEKCSAYISGDTYMYITTEDALRYALSGVEGIMDGYDPYDVYAMEELHGLTIGEMIENVYRLRDRLRGEQKEELWQ